MSDTVTCANPDRRTPGRTRLPMDVLCRIAPGRSPEVWLTEISLSGCQLKIRAGLLTARQYVAIKPPDIESLPGTVRWVQGGAAGVQFERPLHEAVLRHLLYEPPQSPAPRSHQFVDRFGRPLPDRRHARGLAGSRSRPCL
jgi:hypothetical protein